MTSKAESTQMPVVFLPLFAMVFEHVGAIQPIVCRLFSVMCSALLSVVSLYLQLARYFITPQFYTKVLSVKLLYTLQPKSFYIHTLGALMSSHTQRIIKNDIFFTVKIHLHFQDICWDFLIGQSNTGYNFGFFLLFIRIVCLIKQT